VKRSGRDKPMWVAIYKSMEAMLGISLYSYLYLKLAKMIWKGEVGQTMYTYVSKSKNDKIKGEKKNISCAFCSKVVKSHNIVKLFSYHEYKEIFHFFFVINFYFAVLKYIKPTIKNR
jgi:hypothetical protein